MIISENELDNWVRGHNVEARGVIVELVSRLVTVSCPGALLKRFPLVDVMGQSGADGELQTDLPFEPFVPKGFSIWEIGVGEDAQLKATEDYKKDTKNIPKAERIESAFIFVTPMSASRSWPRTWNAKGQRRWIAERQKSNEWKSIHIIDGTQLVDWLSQWHGVKLWLAGKMGMAVERVESPEQRWKLICTYGEPPHLTPSVFLANRESLLPRLAAVFDGSVQRLKLQSHHQGQVADLVSAWIETLDADKRFEYGGKCLLVSKQDLRSVLDTVDRPHVIVANGHLQDLQDEGTEIVQRALHGRHALIYEGSPGGLPDPTAASFPNPKGEHVREALQNAGYPEQRARALAQKSDGNLKTLVRLLQKFSTEPEWAQRTEAAELKIAQLLGSWRDTSEADKDIAETISGKTFGEWIGSLQALLAIPDTPLIQLNGRWRVTCRYEVWHTVGHRLFDADLDRFRESCTKVLTERDPQFDLQPDQRYAASIHGKIFRHSVALRKGMAESLALLGSFPKALSSCTNGKAEATTALVVRELLSSADWMRWASLDDLLPLLAEASPDEFLQSVEDALDTVPCPFEEAFKQETGSIFGRNYTTGLLWALETLAWEPNCLVRVTILLGQLAQRDPGGNWANRPINSLTTIFLPWHPQTCATIERRITAVETLNRELPNVAWKLLLSLIPNSNQTTMGTRKPEWREIIPPESVLVTTWADYHVQTLKYSELALVAAQIDTSKLLDLIERLHDLPPTVGDQLLAYLTSEPVTSMVEPDRVKIWTGISSIIARHKKFADSKWSMKGDRLKKAEDAVSSLAPQSPFYRYQRLFTDRDFDLFEEKGDYNEQQMKLHTQRISAVKAIFEVGGLDLILEFVRIVESTWRVGFAFGSGGGFATDDHVVPALLDTSEANLSGFCGGFVKGRFHKDSWEWVDSMDASRWTSTQTGIFLAYLPFAQETWDRSKLLLGHDESDYWSRTTANAHEANVNVSYGIDRLIEFGRPFAATQCLAVMLFRNERIDWRLSVRALDAGAHSLEPPQRLDVYSLVEVIISLQNDPDANPADVMRVEWAYLQLLDEYHNASPRFLERQLAEEPAFFSELVQMVFRSENEPDRVVDITETQRARARNAYHLLNEWQIPPGTLRNGVFDGQALRGWIDRVRDICIESGHLTMAEQRIGHVLTHAPIDSSGLWLHNTVAEVLDAKGADEMRKGFRIELFNSRGTTMFSAGSEERELANTYSDRAKQLEERGLHRIAQTIRDLANEYDLLAEREASEDYFDEIL